MEVGVTSTGFIWGAAIGVVTFHQFSAEGMWCGKVPTSYGYWSNGSVFACTGRDTDEDTASLPLPALRASIEVSDDSDSVSGVSDDLASGSSTAMTGGGSSGSVLSGDPSMLLCTYERFRSGDRVGFVLDTATRLLQFTRNGKTLGEPIELEEGLYLPCASTSWSDVSILAHSSSALPIATATP
eukprot:EC793674.1.p1 GENE.EC793674.1~~EC793674.1.p1  ORF type:complete len:184 (+),score=48.34 EC793674.1:58-609(+)